MDLDGRKKWGGVGRIKRMRNHNQDILHEREKSLYNKRKGRKILTFH